MPQTKSRLVRSRVSEREGQMLDSLCERLGKNPSEMVRLLISEKFLKVFPKYAEKKGAKPVIEEPELTPEQACEQSGGRVETVEGVRMCVFQLSKSMTSNVPLSKPEMFKKYRKK